MSKQVKVIIPFYREELNKYERASLANTMNILSAHPIVWLKPAGLNLKEFTEIYPEAEIMEVSSQWLGKENGVTGYNIMMMSEGFYNLFTDTEYILICHLDAWIFRDELSQWCQKGYDLVAPPWPERIRYKYFPLKQFMHFQQRLSPERIFRSQLFGKIGNGGLSLRNVSACHMACRQYADKIDFFLSKGYYEDVFWALIPKNLHYPTYKVALQFAYDTQPKLCHRQNHQQLPMGCHGFMHKSRIQFWKQFIHIQ